MIRLLLNQNVDSNTLLITFFMYLIILFVSFPIHEFAHAAMANALGDRTPDLNGRLTINPFAHIDGMGAIMMILLGFGWGKPVETNPNNYTRKISMRGGMALVAFAGPLSNILMGLLGVIVMKLLPGEQENFIYAIEIFINVNIFLAVFNLLPIPPLDGSKILMVLLSPRAYAKYLAYDRYFLPILLVLMFTGVLYTVISYASALIYLLLDLLTFFL